MSGWGPERKRNNISHHITPHQTGTPHRHTTPHHVTPHHATPHHATPHRHTTPHHTTLHYITLHYITIYYIESDVLISLTFVASFTSEIFFAMTHAGEPFINAHTTSITALLLTRLLQNTRTARNNTSFYQCHVHIYLSSIEINIAHTSYEVISGYLARIGEYYIQRWNATKIQRRVLQIQIPNKMKNNAV